MNEKELIVEYIQAKENKDALEKSLHLAQTVFDEIERQIIEHMEATGLKATATYEGLGYIQANKPKLHARYLKENSDKILSYVKEINREDLISVGVSPQKLSAFVAESIENGKEIPEFISWYLKPQIKLYK